VAKEFCLSIETGFRRHLKVRKFCRLMGGNDLAWGYLIALWEWAVEAAPRGDLTGIDVPEIEDGVGYQAADEKCYRAMVDAGFIDEGPNGDRAIHNWMKPGRTGYALARLEAERDRWRRAKGLPTASDQDSHGNPAGTTRESPGNPVPSRFTVHGSEISPPASDPGTTEHGASGTENAPPAASGAAPAHTVDQRPITGHALLTVYAALRSEVVPGAMPWVTPPNARGKASDFAETLVAAGVTWAEVKATMRLQLAEAKAEVGKALADASFGFGAWCSGFSAYREAHHGRAPPAARKVGRAGPAPPPARTDDERRRNAIRPPADWKPPP
jgi:hypothetical protein